jgi:hypothetical protein
MKALVHRLLGHWLFWQYFGASVRVCHHCGRRQRRYPLTDWVSGQVIDHIWEYTH